LFSRASFFEFDLSSGKRDCARLGGEVAPPLGLVKQKLAVLVVLGRWHRRAAGAAGAAVRRAVNDEVLGAVEEETGPAAMRRLF